MDHPRIGWVEGAGKARFVVIDAAVRSTPPNCASVKSAPPKRVGTSSGKDPSSPYATQNRTNKRAPPIFARRRSAPVKSASLRSVVPPRLSSQRPAWVRSASPEFASRRELFEVPAMITEKSRIKRLVYQPSTEPFRLSLGQLTPRRRSKFVTAGRITFCISTG
jgi:hypothetical protein